MKRVRVLTPILPELFGPKSTWRVKKTIEYAIKPPKDSTPEIKRDFKLDRRWCYMIPCSKGRVTSGVRAHIYAFGLDRLAYTGMGMKLRAKLLAMPDVKAHQTGDEEFTVTFPVSAMARVAAVVVARVKKVSKKHFGITSQAQSESKSAFSENGSYTPT